MTTINTAYTNADKFGHASFEAMDTIIGGNLLAGPGPKEAPFAVLLADSITLPQFAVVALDGSNHLVLATNSGNKAIGVLAHAAASGAGNATVRGQVWFDGTFNLNSDSPLVWDASFDTDAKKAAAFLGSPSPCSVIVRHRNTPAS